MNTGTVLIWLTLAFRQFINLLINIYNRQRLPDQNEGVGKLRENVLRWSGIYVRCLRLSSALLAAGQPPPPLILNINFNAVFEPHNPDILLEKGGVRG